jgi:hypothetical protein
LIPFAQRGPSEGSLEQAHSKAGQTVLERLQEKWADAGAVVMLRQVGASRAWIFFSGGEQ